jgi:hypothetical protein
LPELFGPNITFVVLRQTNLPVGRSHRLHPFPNFALGADLHAILVTAENIPAKVGNRRAPERGGNGTNWRKGADKRTHLLKET